MSDQCDRCGHPAGPHILAATVWTGDNGKTPVGGYRFCPVAGCNCEVTWSVPDDVAGFDVRARLVADGPMDADTVKRVRGH